MKSLIIVLTSLNILFLFMHEFEAFYKGEWRMFKFLQKFDDKTQFLIFLYAHLPITLFAFYYLWTVYNFNNYLLWIIVNILTIFHLVIHLIALKWHSNVFKCSHSFIFIACTAICGIINLCFMGYY
ncbi:MAG: hypothetical protein PHV30_10030 [Candidatus Margulisbacteria bacterium]|nr:hypothetical protein [Candidatus Margulisiibacteriota bacterium]